MTKGFICILALASFVPSRSANLSFTIITNESSISLGGTAASFPIQEQSPGSLTTHFFGQIQALVTGATLVFPGGSALTALTNGSWQPLPGGSTGQAPADYGGKANVFGATAYAAFRKVALDVQSGLIPLKSDNTFEASALTFVFPTNSTTTFDYD